MTLTAAQQKLVARAKLYPFDPPSMSYLFAERACWNLRNYDLKEPKNASVEIGGILQPINEALMNHGYSPAGLFVPRIPVLASGSNASPTRLREKFSSNPGQTLIPVVKYQVLDMLPVFSAKFASYGSITGFMRFSDTLGTFLAPWFAGWIYDQTGSYSISLITFTGAMLLSACLFAICRKPLVPVSNN